MKPMNKRLAPALTILIATSKTVEAAPDAEKVKEALAISSDALQIIENTLSLSGKQTLEYAGEAVGKLARPLGITKTAIDFASGNYAATAGDFAALPITYVAGRAGFVAGRLAGPKATIVVNSLGGVLAEATNKQVERGVNSFADLFVDKRSAQEILMDDAGIDPVEFAKGYDLDSEEGRNKYKQELWRRLKAPSLDDDKSISRSSSNNEAKRAALNLAESQLQSSLSSQTTGLASPLGSARPTRSPDPKLERALAMELNSPFTTSVETPDTKSSGAFAGADGLNVAGMLRVFAYDSGRLQDGDRVRLTVTDSRGVQLTRNITLTFGGKTSSVSARRGVVKVKITALNVGSSPPNTGGLRVSGDVSGNRSGSFNLSKGQSGTLVVRVLGN